MINLEKMTLIQEDNKLQVIEDPLSFDEKLKSVIKENKEKFIDSRYEELRQVNLSSIKRQNNYSVRVGGACELVVKGRWGSIERRKIWVKIVEQPEKTYRALISLYEKLKSGGLSENITKPFWYDLDLGVIFLQFINGDVLLRTTLKNVITFRKQSRAGLDDLFYEIGKWSQKFHAAMITDRSILMRQILLEIADVLADDKYFCDSEKEIIGRHIRNIPDHLKDQKFWLVKMHNDFSLRNIFIKDNSFGIIDWDAMVHPDFPSHAPVWKELSSFLINLQGLLRIYPFTSKRSINKYRKAFLNGYFALNSQTKREYIDKNLYIFTLCHMLGIGCDRTLPNIYTKNFGGRYIKMLKKCLLRGHADVAA